MKDVEIIKARNVLSPRARTNLAKRLRVAAYCRVSTDSEDQLNSYKSQVQHYTDLIKSKSEWDLAGIYADEAITGTQVTKREDFQRLINDCMNGDVDMIITKSISRFARNTLDTLKYVRMLKEKGIAVFFEEENINTLTMDGELLLVILSSVAQQEVENISANVKKGLKMKMQRGELVGFQGCLGYDYHPEDKSISINEEEAEIVRYIFRRYIEGAGGSVIAQELENLGYKTKRGSTRWAETTVIGIIKNEKYKGDILMGKTFTLDPISKRRLDNFGEEDQFYIRDHHEAIISEEMFEKAQEILKRRAKPRRLGTDGKREKFSRKYAFSCMLECGFCGGTLTRRSWHSGSQYNKVIWQCVTATKKGKKFCPDSKGIAEETIEQAFIESYRLLCQNNKDVLDEFIARTEETLSDSNASKQLAKVEKNIAALDAKRAKLVDMRLEEIIDKETYEQKYFDLSSQIEQLQKQRESLQESAETESTMKKRIAEFRRTLEENEVLDTFDRYVFESIVEKVIVGGYDEDGNKDPAMLTFIYKTGFKNSLDGTNFKPPRKNSKAAKQNAGLCSHTTDEAKSMCSYHSDDTRGECMPSVMERGKVMMEKYFEINEQDQTIRCKLYCDGQHAIEKVVLYGHGFAGHKDNGTAQEFAARVLSEHSGIAVLTFNLPCHGDDIKKRIVLEDCLTYLDIVVTYIRAQLRTASIYSYATSFGGYLVLKYISEYGNPFVKIALRCPAVPMADVLTGTIMKRDELAMILKGQNVQVGFDRKIEVNRQFLSELEESDIQKRDYRGFAEDILILHGTEDEIVPFESGQRFAENNQIAFIPVKNADHRFLDPACAELATEKVLEFFGF